jgi:caffeoyl-CoA O-methyltransferase
VKDAPDSILRPEQAAYTVALEPPRDALLSKIEARAAERNEPISDPEVASFLAVVARAAGVRFIVELGTNLGYGAIVMARAAGPRARVLTIEIAHELCDTARGYVAEAGLDDRIEVRQGSALAELEKIDQPIDLLYIDCVKEEYPEYLEAAVPRLSERGMIVADNTLWKGLVAKDVVPSHERSCVEGLRTFNARLVSHPQLRGVILPLGDGVGFAVRV